MPSAKMAHPMKEQPATPRMTRPRDALQAGNQLLLLKGPPMMVQDDLPEKQPPSKANQKSGAHSKPRLTRTQSDSSLVLHGIGAWTATIADDEIPQSLDVERLSLSHDDGPESPHIDGQFLNHRHHPSELGDPLLRHVHSAEGTLLAASTAHHTAKSWNVSGADTATLFNGSDEHKEDIPKQHDNNHAFQSYPATKFDAVATKHTHDWDHHESHGYGSGRSFMTRHAAMAGQRP